MDSILFRVLYWHLRIEKYPDEDHCCKILKDCSAIASPPPHRPLPRGKHAVR